MATNTTATDQRVQIVSSELSDRSTVYGIRIHDMLTGADVTLPAVDYKAAYGLYLALQDNFGCKGV